LVCKDKIIERFEKLLDGFLFGGGEGKPDEHCIERSIFKSFICYQGTIILKLVAALYEYTPDVTLYLTFTVK
jgi:hypothetical protein